MSSMLLQLFRLAFMASVLHAEHEDDRYLLIAPQSSVVEIGTNFTATCVINNTDEVTADDLYWNRSFSSVVPKEYYTKINASALAVTIPITNRESEWLFCHANKKSTFVFLNKSKFMHGIWLAKRYPPKRATNLSCVAEQKGKEPSIPVLSCTWETVGHQTKDEQTNYTLMVEVMPFRYNSSTTPHNKASVYLGNFPYHTNLEIWVVSQNSLGKIESEYLRQDANYFVKTSAPSNVTVIVEQSFPTSLLVKWQRPIHQVYIKLRSQIRFCPYGSHDWRYVDVPNADISDQTSLRLQDLQPGKDYVIQVRCKNFRRNHGYWSDWSDSVTETTPEDRPTSKPDLWWKSESGEAQLICKEPKFSNGRITAFSIKWRYTKNESWEEIIPVNGSGTQQSVDQRPVTLLKRISLADKPFVRVCVTATNSVGTSPEACLLIPAKPSGPLRVEGMKVSTQDGQMFVEWKQPNSTAVTEYVIEWMSNGKVDWQRERNSTNKTAIKEKLQPYVCYNVSVYPIQSGFIRKPACLEAYFEQGAPSEGPVTQSNPAYDSAELWWNPIPLDKRRGFITNYTIFYQKDDQLKHITVPGNITSYDLTSLSGNTKYDVWIRASTIAGSKDSIRHSFTTLKYAPGMVAGVVVGVSLGFLFFVLMATLLCFYKKEVIKKNLWPQIPNPGESTIGNWSPDYPSKVETPKENCATGVCVLNVGVCEVTPGFEEDKTSLSLKKDKYLSEEHSSGIGGSSCMSSPRQSVSDSDEGPDLADSTASTVQYSSVVASSGYKGQTPAPQPQHSIFSRSESTQPLLDSEEHPDMVQEGSRQVQCSPRELLFTHGAENQNAIESDNCRLLGMEQHDFCPLKEEAEQTTESDSQSADAESASPSSSYMPQLGGYRPQ